MEDNIESHITTEQIVEKLAGQGFREEDIALVAGKRSLKRLRTQFRKELDLGPVNANHAVANSLFDLATTGKNANAMMFWLKCRAKWNVNPGSPWENEDVEVVFGNCQRIDEE